MTVGSRLKGLREQAQYDRPEIAKLLHMPYTTYVNYETDQRKPNDLVLVRIADFYNVSTDYLLERTDNPAPKLNGNGYTGRRKYLMDKIAKMDEKKLEKLDKLMEIIDDEEGHLF